MRQRGDWLYLEEATAAADDLLGVFAPEAVEKASNPLSRGGFNGVVRRLAARIARDARGEDARAIRAAAKRLDRKWVGMRAVERAAAIRAAAAVLLKVPAIVIPKVTVTLLEANTAIVQTTKAAVSAAHELKLSGALNRIDQSIIDHAASSQGSYITDSYGVRAAAYEERARRIVSAGIEAGYDSATIGDQLSAALSGPMLGRAEAYWETVASIHAARARSYGMLASFGEASITAFQWHSTLDEATSEVCRFMHGRTFQVAQTLDRYRKVASGDEEVTEAQPFLRQGRTDKGESVLFTESGGKRNIVGRVDEPGFGTKDKIGTYSRSASDAALQKLGVSSPPAHGRCRSTIDPVFT